MALAGGLLAGGFAPALGQEGVPKPDTPQVRQAKFARLPYWDGMWIGEHLATNIGGISKEFLEAREKGEPPPRNIMSLNGFGAPWNEEGKRRQAERAKTGGNRKAMGWGYPGMMSSNAPIQFLFTPEEVLIINAYRDVRHIYTDGRPHPPADDLWPTVWGDSVGHWEGDTLVIDTVAVRNPNMFFHGGPPLSDDAHYVERLRKTGPDRIEGTFTITDPTTLTQPWVVQVAYKRAEGFDRMISIDFENDRTGSDSEGVNTIEPPKDEQ